MCCIYYHTFTIYLIIIHNVVEYSTCFRGNMSEYSNYSKHITKLYYKSPESPLYPETIISGVQPSGRLHLGNYFGCIFPCLKAQENRKDVNFMIANLHSITTFDALAEIRAKSIDHSLDDLSLEAKTLNDHSLTPSRQALALCLSCGLDPCNGTRFYYQSQIDAILRLNWIIACMISTNRVQRLTRLRKAKAISLGLVCYPVLMAADILSIKATSVIANKDQGPHVELSRYIAKKLNSFLNNDYFPLPEIDLSESKSIMSLVKPTEKMSKSDINDFSRIGLLDTPQEVMDKIKGAVTDSVRGLSVEPIKRPGVTNLIKIYTLCTGNTQESAINDFSELGFIEFKQSVAEAVIEFLKPIQKKYYEIINDNTYLNNVSNQGAEYINSVSNDSVGAFNWLF